MDSRSGQKTRNYYEGRVKFLILIKLLSILIEILDFRSHVSKVLAYSWEIKRHLDISGERD